jgi:hypothetical protein
MSDSKKHIHIDLLTIFKTCFWMLFCSAVIAVTILFILERSRVNGDKFNCQINSTYVGMYSINDIKQLISNGNLTDSQSLANAYIAMYQHAKYPLIDFSLMVSFFANFQTPPSDPATA